MIELPKFVEMQNIDISPSPASFRGKFSAFFRDHVEGNLPSAGRVTAFDRSLREYLSGPDPIHITRWVNPRSAPQERGKIYTTPGGQLRPSDNAPVWWLHAFLLSGAPIPSGKELGELFAVIPCHMFQIGQFKHLNKAGYHAAHIVNAKDRDTNWHDWGREQLFRRVLVNIHPCNMFLAAKAGWNEHGGRPDIISWVIGAYRERYGDTMDRFLSDVGYLNEPAHKEVPDPDYEYEELPTIAPPAATYLKRPKIRKIWIGEGRLLAITTVGQRFLVPHDDLVKWALENTNVPNTKSWRVDGVYSWPKATKAMREFLKPYRVLTTWPD